MAVRGGLIVGFLEVGSSPVRTPRARGVRDNCKRAIRTLRFRFYHVVEGIPVRRSDEQIFLDKLVYMAGSPPARVSSRALIQELSWSDDRYQRARSRLIDAGLIKGVLGGPGGSLEVLKGVEKLSAKKRRVADAETIPAFISYSHADAKIKGDLVKRLAPLERLRLVSHWDDGEIKAGDHWEKAIADQMAAAHLILLLISSDFISSKFCYEKELASALRRDKAGSARVIPVILRPCLWQDLPFGKLQALPHEGRPVTSWPIADEALMEVAKAIREVAQAMRDGARAV